jgi:hypothetical protein
VPARRLLRIVTALLLAWVAFDLAAIDTCALDVGRGRAPRQTSVAPLDSPGAVAHHHAALHPDHCFCHGLSTGADTTAALIDPFFIGRDLPDAPPGHLLCVSSALDHPPQLTV